MSNVIAFKRALRHAIRWSPLPYDAYKLIYQGSLDGAKASLVFEARAYDAYRDTATWNLFYAFHRAYRGKAESDELLVTADNPRTNIIEAFTGSLVADRRVRDWILELHPLECVEFLSSEATLPFPGKGHKERALARLSHLASAP